MKLFISFILTAVFSTNIFCQTFNVCDYNDLIGKMEHSIMIEDYAQAWKDGKTMWKNYKDNIQLQDELNLLGVFLLKCDTDASKQIFDDLQGLGITTDYLKHRFKKLDKCYFLQNIWTEIIPSKINNKYVSSLSDMLDQDQAPRKILAYKKVIEIDSINNGLFLDLIQEYGWPNGRILGYTVKDSTLIPNSYKSVLIYHLFNVYPKIWTDILLKYYQIGTVSRHEIVWYFHLLAEEKGKKISCIAPPNCNILQYNSEFYYCASSNMEEFNTLRKKYCLQTVEEEIEQSLWLLSNKDLGFEIGNSIPQYMESPSDFEENMGSDLLKKGFIKY